MNQMWFVKFHAGDFIPEPCNQVEQNCWWYAQLGSMVDINPIKRLENNKHYTTQEVVKIFKTSKPNTENHLDQLGYMSCYDV